MADASINNAYSRCILARSQGSEKGVVDFRKVRKEIVDPSIRVS